MSIKTHSPDLHLLSLQDSLAEVTEVAKRLKEKLTAMFRNFAQTLTIRFEISPGGKRA